VFASRLSERTGTDSSEGEAMPWGAAVVSSLMSYPRACKADVPSVRRVASSPDLTTAPSDFPAISVKGMVSGVILGGKNCGSCRRMTSI
jgi:hypothetical protein